MKLALRDWIGVALIGAFVGALSVLFWKAIPEANKDLITYMLGQLSGFVAGVVSFHYVTSKGDEQKSANTGKALDAIAAVANATGQPDPTAIRDGDEVTVERKP